MLILPFIDDFLNKIILKKNVNFKEVYYNNRISISNYSNEIGTATFYGGERVSFCQQFQLHFEANRVAAMNAAVSAASPAATAGTTWRKTALTIVATTWLLLSFYESKTSFQRWKLILKLKKFNKILYLINFLKYYSQNSQNGTCWIFPYCGSFPYCESSYSIKLSSVELWVFILLRSLLSRVPTTLAVYSLLFIIVSFPLFLQKVSSSIGIEKLFGQRRSVEKLWRKRPFSFIFSQIKRSRWNQWRKNHYWEKNR